MKPVLTSEGDVALWELSTRPMRKAYSGMFTYCLMKKQLVYLLWASVFKKQGPLSSPGMRADGPAPQVLALRTVYESDEQHWTNFGGNGEVGFRELARKLGENHGKPEKCFELACVMGKQEATALCGRRIQRPEDPDISTSDVAVSAVAN
ncbi:hypothetical protein MG293_011465 [Ovis ammon polii]|uniref:Uncharacterized protein n=1 Tax=Ovis ammon polii TaxID=230172 RepID=A0AAD4Y8F0_OVIAM|nr:hypothetical protein MG293_011465 [Ovis ammon polii]KAI4562268.1 hypothetical protein MJT46_011230 [Ovis ammon polii x Ovis aries]